jgi:hypothetical protein
MDQIFVDDTFTRQLSDTISPCVVVDSAGRKLGYFTRAVDQSFYEGLEPSVDEGELHRREQAGGGRPLADILRDLSKRH